MTSYDDRPNNDPWAPPAWSARQAAPVRPTMPIQGIETRQVLLILGASCLVAALAAGTALVWHALGPAGQAALMLAVTASVLVLAIRLERLPATAQALAAVGVAGLLIDAVAGRSLELGGLRDLPLHVYAGLAASTVTLLLAGLSLAVRRLWAPPIGASVAAMAAVAAWMQPTSIDRVAWFGLAAGVMAVLLERVLAEAGSAAVVGRFVNASMAIPLAGLGAAASVVAATHDGNGTYAGAALVLLLMALPEAVGIFGEDLEKVTAAAAGLLAGALMVASVQGTATDVQVAVAGVMAALGAGGSAMRVRAQRLRLQRGLQVASLTVATATYALLTNHSDAFVHLNAVDALLCIAIALAWRGRESTPVRGLAATAAVPFATTAVDLQLHLERVTTPEAYVLVPAFGMVVLAAAAMFVWPATSSWLLAPGLVFGLLPTVWGALESDGPRQAVALGAAAALVVIGAQLRLAGPLFVGAGALSLVVLRLVGPEVKRVPEWVALGVVGIVLLTLGATWEARMLDFRRATQAIRPRIAALR